MFVLIELGVSACFVWDIYNDTHSVFVLVKCKKIRFLPSQCFMKPHICLNAFLDKVLLSVGPLNSKISYFLVRNKLQLCAKTEVVLQFGCFNLEYIYIF